VSGPLEILAGRQLEDTVIVGGCPKIAGIAIIADPLILLREFPADALGIVCRSVIRNNQFKVGKRLPQDRLNGIFDVPFTVVDRKSNTNLRHCTILSNICPAVKSAR
jgi:hypothetical protein